MFIDSFHGIQLDLAHAATSFTGNGTRQGVEGYACNRSQYGASLASC